jgi:hypothetical protein
MCNRWNPVTLEPPRNPAFHIETPGSLYLEQILRLDFTVGSSAPYSYEVWT